MPQVQLPIFPAHVTHITNELAFSCENGMVSYFNGHLPVFTHAENDLATFRMFTSQLCANDNAQLVDIQRAFGIPIGTVKRYLKIYRENGPKGFYTMPRKHSASQLTDPVRAQAKELLDQGMSVPEVGRKLGILADTIRKAIYSGRLPKPKKKIENRVKAARLL